jgi:aryl-alcohol dehydrogenase-like predicted oxidoreductase
MEYRRVGTSGLRVSEIALGNWLTHGGSIDNDMAIACVHAALDEDITFFDTADVYNKGRAETVLGEALKDQRREDLVVATKVFWPMSDNPNDEGLSRKHIIESCNNSLKRLQMDYVDLYQAHRYDEEVPLHETLRAFDDLVRSGKVLYVGVSEWNADQIADAMRIADEMGFDRLISNQPQYSMLWRVPEAEVMPLCRKEGLGQVVWSPLAMGVLTGKYEPGHRPAAGTRGATGKGGINQYLDDKTLTAVQNLRPVADELGIKMSTLALAWVLQNDNVAAAIIGATRPEQVAENVQASGIKLSDDVLRQIDEVLDGVTYTDPSLTGG